MVIKRVEPISCAKMTGVLYAILGIVVGAGFSLFALLGGMATNNPQRAAAAGILGVGAVILFPILYGVAGFVTTLVGAWLYNVVAGLVGGVEIDVQ